MRFLGIIAVVLAAGCACADGESVVIEGAAGEQILDICAEVAATEAERRAGLRGRPPLDPGTGLLLDFPVTGEVCIVNVGVGFAIDAAYAGDDGVITAIERRVPADDATPRCHLGTRQVLEVSAGAFDGVEVGDRLR